MADTVGMPGVDGDQYFDLSMDELREVTRFALADAESLVEVFERGRPGDDRPRAAVEAARAFAAGERRSRLQRITAVAAHRAAREAGTEVTRQAAHAAGDAAASAYLHPFARATQVPHILGASARAAYVAELMAGDVDAGLDHVSRSVTRATALLADVLRRYPPAPTGTSRLSVLMQLLDVEIRRL